MVFATLSGSVIDIISQNHVLVAALSVSDLRLQRTNCHTPKQVLILELLTNICQEILSRMLFLIA